MMPMVVNFRYNETTGREGFVVHNKQLPCDDEFAFMVKVVVDHHPVHPQPQRLTPRFMECPGSIQTPVGILHLASAPRR